MAVNLESKQRELDWWKDWHKTQKPEPLNNLLRSIDPFLQTYVNKYNASPLPRPAIESQARILAVKAFQTYNPRKAALNTHVGHELKHLHRYVLEYQNIGKIPENRGIAISKFKNMKAHLEDELGRPATTIELAERLNWNPAEVSRMQTELRQDLNITSGSAEEGFFDYVINDTDPLKNAIEYVYYESGPIEKKVLEYSFGLGGNPKITITEMAMKLHFTDSQIRNIRKDLAAKINKIQGML
jgi:DNA-directed RNA polymerase sigma subunit (sigma70/sigma32)